MRVERSAGAGALLLLLLLCAVPRAPGAETGATNAPVAAAACLCDAMKPEALAGYVRGHLEIGTRITAFILDTSKRPEDPELHETFIGHVNRLDEDQNLVPAKLYADYMFSPYLGVELAYDEVSARTINSGDGPSDGVAQLSGPILSLVLRRPVGARLVPYVAAGVAFWSGSFDHETWWARGWASEADFNAAGQPPGARNGLTRRITVDDDVGPAVAAGCLVRLTPHVALELLARYIDVTGDATFLDLLGDNVIQERHGEFPMGHLAYGGGVRCCF